jgi:hypothetical protein
MRLRIAAPEDPASFLRGRGMELSPSFRFVARDVPVQLPKAWVYDRFYLEGLTAFRISEPPVS